MQTKAELETLTNTLTQTQVFGTLPVQPNQESNPPLENVVDATLKKMLSPTGGNFTDKLPVPSYFTSGLILPCYYVAEHDYYLGWHKEAGLRVISGRYAEGQQKPSDGTLHNRFDNALINIPIHLVIRREKVEVIKQLPNNVRTVSWQWEVEV